MAGDWIKMRGNLWDDPRVTKLCDLTDQSEATVIGGLYWLWAAADQHTEDGIMPGLTLRQIDRKTGIQGLGDALVSIGWLADHPEGVRIVDFEKHNGTSAKKRCQTAKRVANHAARNAGVTQDDAETNAQSVSTTLAREEKRREESNTECYALLSAAVLPTDPEEPETGEMPPGFPDCPHGELLALYRKHLPHLAQPRSWTGNRATQLRNRWRDAGRKSAYSEGYKTHDDGIAWWDSFFGYIANDTKLANGFESKDRSWRPDIEWIAKAANFQKIIDGKYDK